MPARFSEVVKGLLYRGGAPEPWEVKALKDVYGIKQIISLDADVADKIADACKENGINHIVIKIEDGVLDDSFKIRRNGATNIIGNKPTYVHCYHGKDRTGLFVAKFRLENGATYKEAMDEAYSFGFGTGMDDETVANYKSIITSEYGNYEIKKGAQTLCNSCGMLKEKSICKYCEQVNEDMKNIKKELNGDKHKTVLQLSQDEPYNCSNLDEDGTCRTVSNLFSGAQSILNSSRIRQNIIKNLMRKEILKAADDYQITFKVPQNEKKNAQEACEKLDDFVTDGIEKFNDALDIMYNPFKGTKPVSTDELSKAGLYIDKYSDFVEETLTDFKTTMFHIIELIKNFDSDSSINSLLSSIDDSINLIDKSIENFIDVLSDKTSDTFKENCVKAIEIIKKEISQLERLCDNLKDYLQDNIIKKDWSSEIREEIKEERQEQE